MTQKLCHMAFNLLIFKNDSLLQVKAFTVKECYLPSNGIESDDVGKLWMTIRENTENDKNMTVESPIFSSAVLGSQNTPRVKKDSAITGAAMLII